MDTIITKPKQKSRDQYERELLSAQAYIEKLESQLRNDLGKGTSATISQGHIIDKKSALIRRPLFNANINDPSWAGRLVIALSAAKTMGYELFEVSIDNLPVYELVDKDIEQHLTGIEAMMYGSSRMSQQKSLEQTANVQIKVWALIVASRGK